MKHKSGLVFLLLLVCGLAINVNMQNPINGDLRRGFISAVAVAFPEPGCRAYRGSIDVFDPQGVQIASNSASFRGVAPSEVELDEARGQGSWSGYWDGSAVTGTYNISMTIYEDCAGVTRSDTKWALVDFESPVIAAGVPGSIQRAASVGTSIMILIFGTDLAQIVNPNTSTTLIDEFGGMSLALLLFGFLVPFILAFSILYDMFLLVGFFRPNTARLIAFIISLLFSRANGFGAIYSILFTVFSNFWISMVSLVFMMMIMWWVLGHMLWGYKFTQEIHGQAKAMEYLHSIKEQMDKQAKGTGNR